MLHLSGSPAPSVDLISTRQLAGDNWHSLGIALRIPPGQHLLYPTLPYHKINVDGKGTLEAEDVEVRVDRPVAGVDVILDHTEHSMCMKTELLLLYWCI